MAGGRLGGRADLASWFVAKAMQAYGDRVLADADLGAARPQAVGRELARLIFARLEADSGIPPPLAAVPDRSGRGALETRIADLLEADPGLAVAAGEVLSRCYRDQLDSGDSQTLAELGDLLWWDEP
jgi:hypothetical protein